MGLIHIDLFSTLDGVAQAPGGPDEDSENGFAFGGWQAPLFDEIVGEQVGAGMADLDALLLGRKTYDIFAASWGVWDENAEGFMGELTRRYNRIPKYVASRTLTDTSWKNTHLLGPDVPAAVAKLRDEPGGEIRVWGSAQLIRTLAEHDLVDEYRLVFYPIVLGTGKKLFPDGFPVSRLTLVESRPLASGVVVSTYRRS
jgi:dihydrofolate reductase